MENIYNLDYYEKMLRQNSGSAELINKIRWDFVKEINPRLVLDYGSGAGFFRVFRPKDINVNTFDIGNFPQTGINYEHYDLITLFDVLEHIPNIDDLPIWEMSKYIAISIPYLDNVKDIEKWKHYKPGEHLHYWYSGGIDDLFKEKGFKKIKSGTLECPPREDILTILYEKDNS